MGVYKFTHEELNKVRLLRSDFYDLWFRLEAAMSAKFEEYFPNSLKYSFLPVLSRVIRGPEAIEHTLRTAVIQAVGWDKDHEDDTPKDVFNEFVRYAKQIVEREERR